MTGTVKIVNREIFNLHADFCKTLSNPKRLMILAMLGTGELTVGEMAKAIGVPLANISQHLTVLKSKNIVKPRKDGQTVYYTLVDPRLIEACDLIRSILLDGMKRRGLAANDIDSKEVVARE